MPSKQLWIRLTLCLLWLTAMPHLVAQVNTGDVVGRVTDVSGAVLPAAKVTITSTETRCIPNCRDGENGRL